MMTRRTPNMKTNSHMPQGTLSSLLPSFRRRWAWMMLLMCSFLLFSCQDFFDETSSSQCEQNEEEMATLRINVYAPTANSYTTRTEDTEAAERSERIISSIRVYAFLSEGASNTQQAIGHTIVDNTASMTVTDGLEYQWAEMLLPKNVIGKQLDFYAMVNMKGTGFENVEALGYAPTRQAVETCTFTAFGTTNPVTGSVPAAGLPASRILKGVTPVESLEGPNRLSITLLRAVGKYRFFFAKPQGFVGEITKIELNANVLPSSELVMPAPSTDNTVLPHTNAVTLPTGATMTSTVLLYNTPLTNIKEVAEPEKYVKNGNGATETFSQYIARLTDATNGVTEYNAGLTYIRESNAPLKGKIYYKISNVEKEPKEFILQTEDTETHTTSCFPRNHYSVVYAYFQGGGLYVEPQVQPWQWGGELNFFSKTTVQLFVDNEYNLYVDGDEEKKFNYLMYSLDEDNDGTPDYNNWDNNYCAIANGFDGARPKYAPWLVLKTTSMSILQLQTDNTNFGFIVAEKATETTYTYSTILDEVNIPAGKNVTTYFYVVPKGDFNLANPPSRFVNVTLIERNSMGSGSDEISIHRLPWNSILPGSQSHETAQFYYVTGTEYQQNIDGSVSTLSKQ